MGSDVEVLLGRLEEVTGRELHLPAAVQLDEAAQGMKPGRQLIGPAGARWAQWAAGQGRLSPEGPGGRGGGGGGARWRSRGAGLQDRRQGRGSENQKHRGTCSIEALRSAGILGEASSRLWLWEALTEVDVGRPLGLRRSMNRTEVDCPHTGGEPGFQQVEGRFKDKAEELGRLGRERGREAGAGKGREKLGDTDGEGWTRTSRTTPSEGTCCLAEVGLATAGVVFLRNPAPLLWPHRHSSLRPSASFVLIPQTASVSTPDPRDLFPGPAIPQSDPGPAVSLRSLPCPHPLLPQDKLHPLVPPECSHSTQAEPALFSPPGRAQQLPPERPPPLSWLDPLLSPRSLF